MVQQTWNVGKSMAVAHAKWDSQEQNVMNANRILLVTNVIHVVLVSLIIHCVKVYLSSLVLTTPFNFTFQIAFRAEQLYNFYISRKNKSTSRNWILSWTLEQHRNNRFGRCII